MNFMRQLSNLLKPETKALLPFTSNIKNEMIPVNCFSNVSQFI